MPTPDAINFEALQEYANTLEDDYMSKLKDQKKMQKDLENLTSKFEAFRVETAFAAASWRGIADFAKKFFGKELESKASKNEESSKDKELEKEAEV